jgi:hypothetical protein
VPFVNPEKNASAIEQKKMFVPGTSVNGSVLVPAPHMPVSARSRLDNTIIVANKTTAMNLIFFMRSAPALISSPQKGIELYQFIGRGCEEFTSIF